MRLTIPLFAALAVFAVVRPASLRAQAPLTAADSALVGRILLAEDRRDSTAAALAAGARHSDPRIRTIALRARGRIVSPTFASRDSLVISPPLAPPVAWSEPAWRLRFRGLAAQKDDCNALRLALADSAWPVRLHAADLAPASCASNDSLVATLSRWVDALSPDGSRRVRGGVAWPAAAHAEVARARVRPPAARARLPKLASHRQWEVRMYAARAAGLLADTARLRTLADDDDDNVKEAAIIALSALTGHASDAVYMQALAAEGAQAVRAAAKALDGSPRADARAAANREFERWAIRGNASARDTRLALLAAAGRPASDDRPPELRSDLAPDAVAMALGAEHVLRVTLAPGSGGGWFDVRLRGDVAPLMASRILWMARGGYYTNLLWHRVEPDFVIQGGSPDANEYVGFPRFIRDELGTLPHVRGTVGMSTRGHDTGDAQWFVNLRDNLRLDRDYTVFGDVISGMDIVDGILEGDAIGSIVEVPALADTGRVMIPFDALTSAPFTPPDLREAYAGGALQFGELRLPAAATGKRPTVVLLHGGCWRSAYSLAHDAPAASALAREGYVVWMPEYRRVGDAGGGWPGTFDDVGLAIDHLRSLAARYPAIDTTRVVLVGHSAGGELALWAASRGPSRGDVGGRTPLRAAGVVSLAGITDMAAYGAARGGCNSSVPLLLGGSPSEVPERYREASPVDRLPLGVPVWLVHGSADPIVPLSQDETYETRAHAAGDRVTRTVAPDAGHFDLVTPFARAWPSVLRAVRAASAAPSTR